MLSRKAVASSLCQGGEVARRQKKTSLLDSMCGTLHRSHVGGYWERNTENDDDDDDDDDDVVFAGEDLTFGQVGRPMGVHESFYATRASRVRGSDGGAGPSGKDNGKQSLYDEEDIEEDIGLDDVDLDGDEAWFFDE
ncbi:hypothetical protein L1987_15058 [Smallanthus sonchifolius]|uniref:Uncharacterized protein n=1 Tax=Smallanthus sonchifolius TaxID=185202 RepID=A0ACB9J4W0_9ASTR|nr:hypothetical protein L1987_15058 [Smallanthus sonchifolius]